MNFSLEGLPGARFPAASQNIWAVPSLVQVCPSPSTTQLSKQHLTSPPQGTAANPSLFPSHAAPSSSPAASHELVPLSRYGSIHHPLIDAAALAWLTAATLAPHLFASLDSRRHAIHLPSWRSSRRPLSSLCLSATAAPARYVMTPSTRPAALRPHRRDGPPSQDGRASMMKPLADECVRTRPPLSSAT